MVRVEVRGHCLVISLAVARHPPSILIAVFIVAEEIVLVFLLARLLLFRLLRSFGLLLCLCLFFLLIPRSRCLGFLLLFSLLLFRFLFLFLLFFLGGRRFLLRLFLLLRVCLLLFRIGFLFGGLFLR